MAKLYVFGIGGTGARIVKSLTALMATGVEIDFEIVPILIDPDGAGGDLNRTVRMLHHYQTIHNQVAGYEHNKFFKNKVTTLYEVLSERGEESITFSGFRYELDGVQNDKFSDFIGFESLDEQNKSLIELLFKKDNLDSDLKVGFKGNPNIGSVVLNQLTKAEFFKVFANTIERGDRVFIAGSIFGGTGAAGFPLLVKNIRSGSVAGKKHIHLQNAKIGAISVQPYFKLTDDADSEIDSYGFITKTKAALTYYAKNLTGNRSLNALYYIGDGAEKTYQNCEGGTHQKNDAHFVELASAMAIIDFANLDDSDLQTDEGKARQPIYKEFGVNSNGTLTFDTLFQESQLLLKQKLTQYFYFDLFLENAIHDWKTANFAREYNHKIDDRFMQKHFYKTVKNFNKSFRIWLAELSENQQAFSPFSFEVIKSNTGEIEDYKVMTDSIFTLVKGIEYKKPWMPWKQKNYEFFVTELNNAAKKIGDAPDAPKYFLSVFGNGTITLIEKKIF